mmetsp:Transcript_41795/g.118241  ORF Transcript_41795/g.118241 Transcript_41795/m.118241 type:complete len:210 (-) Transcript_41795:1233-1862(-)
MHRNDHHQPGHGCGAQQLPMLHTGALPGAGLRGGHGGLVPHRLQGQMPVLGHLRALRFRRAGGPAMLLGHSTVHSARPLPIVGIRPDVHEAGDGCARAAVAGERHRGMCSGGAVAASRPQHHDDEGSGGAELAPIGGGLVRGGRGLVPHPSRRPRRVFELLKQPKLSGRHFKASGLEMRARAGAAHDDDGLVGAELYAAGAGLNAHGAV